MKRFLSIFITIIFLWKVPSVYSLDSRQELFEEALLLSSGGDFVLALDKWNKYLELFPNDQPAARVPKKRLPQKREAETPLRIGVL